MRIANEIKEEIRKVEKKQKAAVKKQERCVNRLAELKTELLKVEQKQKGKRQVGKCIRCKKEVERRHNGCRRNENRQCKSENTRRLYCLRRKKWRQCLNR